MDYTTTEHPSGQCPVQADGTTTYRGAQVRWYFRARWGPPTLTIGLTPDADPVMGAGCYETDCGDESDYSGYMTPDEAAEWIARAFAGLTEDAITEAVESGRAEEASGPDAHASDAMQYALSGLFPALFPAQPVAQQIGQITVRSGEGIVSPKGAAELRKMLEIERERMRGASRRLGGEVTVDRVELSDRMRDHLAALRAARADDPPTG